MEELVEKAILVLLLKVVIELLNGSVLESLRINCLGEIWGEMGPNYCWGRKGGDLRVTTRRESRKNAEMDGVG